MTRKQNVHLALLAVLLSPIAANAGVIAGGSLLDQSDANQLESWLGVGDQDFTNVWAGTSGVSTVSSFHAGVDGAGPTFSIFGITMSDGSTARIGGYTALDWGGTAGYQSDSTAFIFNLDSGEAQFTQNYTAYSIYRSSTYFSTFGGGHDIWAGYGILGKCGSTTSTNAQCDGYSYSHTYDQSQGQITVAGDSGYGYGNSGLNYNHWSTFSLEVYTIADAAAVPEPGTLALFGLGLFGLALRRKKIV